MKKILTILLVVFAFSAYSQTTIDYVYKRQPIKFSKIALADTMFLSSESPYGTYGNLFVIDSTLDGRFFINDGYALADSLSQIRSEISDTAAQLRLDISDSLAINISDTATQIRAELTDSIAQLRLDISDTATQIRSELSDTATQIRSELSDSTYFQLMGGKYLAINNTGYDSLIIGGNSKDPNAVLQVNGQFNQSFTFMSPSANSVYNARNGNIVILNSDGNISGITNCAIGSVITFTCFTGVTNVILNPANFIPNGQTLRIPNGSIKTFDQYDVFTIICVADDEFLFHSESGDNQ